MASATPTEGLCVFQGVCACLRGFEGFELFRVTECRML